jgi:hypothetical protein
MELGIIIGVPRQVRVDSPRILRHFVVRVINRRNEDLLQPIRRDKLGLDSFRATGLEGGENPENFLPTGFWPFRLSSFFQALIFGTSVRPPRKHSISPSLQGGPEHGFRAVAQIP